MNNLTPPETNVAPGTARPSRRTPTADAPPGPVPRPDPAGPRVEQRSWLWRCLQVIARVGTTLLFDFKVYGLENVPRTGGVLLAANHQSYLDPVLVAVRLYRPVSFLAKSELFENRYFGWLIRSLHAFPVRQGEGDVGAVRETIKRLNEGHVLNIYPEGSRTLDGEIAPLSKGIALVIRKAPVPVVPVAIDGSFDSWGKGRKLFRPYPIRVVYGQPMHLSHLKGDEVVKQLDARLRSMLADLRERRRSEDGVEPQMHTDSHR